MAKIGLKGLTYAVISSGGNGAAVTYTGGATQADLMIGADVSFETEKVKQHADNHVVESANGMTGGSISLELADLPDAIKGKILGCVVSGKVATFTEDESPYVGFGYIVGKIAAGTKSYVGYWYPKVQFSLDSDNARTKGESTEFQSENLTGEILGVITTTGGKVEYYYTDTDSTESAVRTWLNGKAGIS